MYLLGIDIGTSSVKAAIVSTGTATCVASDFFPKQESPIKSLHPGWAEQNPESWIEYIKQSIASVKNKAGVSASDIKAIGISYQMHGLVAIDKGGKVLRDSIIWCDSRGVPYGERAVEELGKDECLSELLNKPGNFTAPKLAWLKKTNLRSSARYIR